MGRENHPTTSALLVLSSAARFGYINPSRRSWLFLDLAVGDVLHMARKILNRKQLRDEVEAAEEAGLMDENDELEEESGESDDEDKPKKKPKAKRKSKAKEPAEVRLKLFWGVYNHSAKRVALFEFSQRKHAEQKAAELSQSGKNPHYVQKVKDPVKEE